MEEVLYKKEGNKYIPCGITVDEKYLSDGIWLVNSNPNGIGMANLGHLLKIGEQGKYTIPQLCAIAEYTDRACSALSRYEAEIKSFREEHGMGEHSPMIISNYDRARVVIKEVLKLNDEIVNF